MPVYYVIALIISAIATAASAVSQSKSASFQEDVAEQQAKQSELNAEDARQRGLIAEEEHRAKVRQFQGSQMAALGTAGIDPVTGTPAEVLEQTAKYGELDALRVRNAAEREAWGMERQGLAEAAQGQMSAAAGRSQAFGTVLSGASRAYGIYRQGKG